MGSCRLCCSLACFSFCRTCADTRGVELITACEVNVRHTTHSHLEGPSHVPCGDVHLAASRFEVQRAALTAHTCDMKWLMGARFAQASPFFMTSSNLSTSLLSMAASSSRSIYTFNLASRSLECTMLTLCDSMVLSVG